MIKFGVYDVESRDWIHLLMNGVYDGRNYIHFKCMLDSLDYMFSTGIEHWFAHFGGKFDIQFMLDAVISDNSDFYKVGDMIPRGSSLFCVEILQTKSNKRIFLRDSSAILPFGLKKAAKAFNVPTQKGEIDFKKLTKVTPQLIDYNEKDCRALYETIQAFYNSPLVKKSGPKFSLASQAFEIMRTYLKCEVFNFSDNLDAAIRPSYFGGRTEIFKPLHRGPEALYCYDVNSLYPFVLQNDFPNQFLCETFKYDAKSFGFWRCRVRVPQMTIPPLGVKHENKYIFPVGEFDGFWTTHELEYAKSLGVEILKVTYGWVFENGGPMFKDFVRDLYDIRSKTEPGSAENIIAKLIMNSCYGRFGIKRQREQVIFDDFEQGNFPMQEFKTKLETIRLAKKPIHLPIFSHVGIASYVTAYARIHLHKLMSMHPEHIYYCDTDSLFTTKKFSTGSGLGALKLEYTAKSAVFLLPKTYHIEGSDFKKVVMKGFDRTKIEHFTREDFLTHLEGEIKTLKIMQDPKFATLRTAMKKGHLLFKTNASTREIKSVYNKRIVIRAGSSFETKPITLGGVPNEADHDQLTFAGL